VIVRIVRRRPIGHAFSRPRPSFNILAQRFFLIAGLLAVDYAIFSYVARDLYQAYQSRIFDRELKVRAVDGRQEPRAATRSWVGKIAIPRLSISAVVKEGVDDRTLDLAVGHIPSTSFPGQPGNVALAAHRDTLFRKLKDVRRNDEITVTTLDGTYTYRVVWFKIVHPEDVSVLEPTKNENTLTLVTCYPFYFVGDAPKRFIVRALQVQPVRVFGLSRDQSPGGYWARAHSIVAPLGSGPAAWRDTKLRRPCG
jgi:sortase A